MSEENDGTWRWKTWRRYFLDDVWQPEAQDLSLWALQVTTCEAQPMGVCCANSSNFSKSFEYKTLGSRGVLVIRMVDNPSNLANELDKGGSLASQSRHEQIMEKGARCEQSNDRSIIMYMYVYATACCSCKQSRCDLVYAIMSIKSCGYGRKSYPLIMKRYRNFWVSCW